MKYLKNYFDFKKFMAGKDLLVLDAKLHYIYDAQGNKTDQSDGTTLNVVITDDKQTEYSNAYEKFNVTVLGVDITNKFDFTQDKYSLRFKNPENVTATVYGQYNNQLSVKTTLDNIAAKTLGD